MKKEAKELKEHYIYQVEQQYNWPIIEDSLLLIVKYYFPDNRRRDRDNRHKLICDSMTWIVYKDDSQIKEASVEMLVDKEKPRIEIYINNYNL